MSAPRHFLDLTEIPNPPPGSSGLRVRFNVNALLDGYRPGRVAKLKLDGFTAKELPSEERMKRLEQRAE